MPGMLGNLTNMVRDWFIQDKLFVGPGVQAQPGDAAGSIYAAGPVYGKWLGAQMILAATVTPTTSPQNLGFTTDLDPFGMVTNSGLTSFAITVPVTGKWRVVLHGVMVPSATVTTSGFAFITMNVGANSLGDGLLSAWMAGDTTAQFRTLHQEVVLQLTAGTQISGANVQYSVAPAPTVRQNTGATQLHETFITVEWAGT